MEFNRVTKVADTLTAIKAGYDDNGRDVNPEILLQSTEQWLKALLWLINRTQWNILNQNKKYFTLFHCIRDLGLLTQKELDTPEGEYRTISDEVRQLIYWNTKDRNYVTHETRDAPEYIRSRYLPSALLTLIAPICKHQDKIRENLKGLIASATLEDPDTAKLIRLIDGERRNHLGRFRAREEWISQLKGRFLVDNKESKPYLLLNGHEGMGKSALSAKMSDELTLRNIELLGPAASETRKIAPWLPGLILHFGKQSNQPDEIVRLLLAQANALLLEPVELSHSLSHPTEEFDPGINLIYTDGVHPNQPNGRGIHSENISPEIRNPANYLVVERSPYYQSIRDTHFQHRSATPDIVQLRRVLYLALEQVSREYGPVVLIIDAVDEISPDGVSLDFLPEHLPPGVSVMLTARQNSQAVSWLMSNRNCEKIRLTFLGRAEIPELTGLQDSEGKKEAEFNERLWKESQGWPVLVQAAVQGVQHHRDDLSAIKISRSADAVFERQVREWGQSTQKTNDYILVDLLHFLCIFEPATRVDLEYIQSYLEQNKISLRLPELRQILQPVHTQLEGLETGQIKLSLKAFAEYVRERHCSKRDLRQALEKVVEWLSIDEDVSAKLLTPFLQHWTNPVHVEDDRFRTIAGKLTSVLVARDDPQLLYEIFQRSFTSNVKRTEKRSKELFLPFAQTCLTTAAKLGHLAAMGTLGNCLIEGVGFKEEQSAGENWLRRAVDKGDFQAKIVLAQRLLNGDGVKQDSTEGEQLLRSAVADGHSEAKGILATRLIDGDGLEKNVAEGERMLRELADSDDQKAILSLAQRLLKGDGINKDVKEGETLLQQLVDAGNDTAARRLADHLLNITRSKLDNEKGIQLLISLTDKNDLSATIRLSNYFLDTEGIPANQRLEGEALLKKAVDSKFPQAKRIYATRLLRGDGVIQDQRTGEMLLIELANDESTSAMTTLGEYYLDSGREKEGQKWLMKAIQADHIPAMAVLGSRLLTGNKVSKNISRGESLLRKAADEGHPQAMGVLGTLLLQGAILNQKLTEGERWLRKAADAGETQAMRALGVRLLNDDGIAKNAVEGEKWLRKAADAGEIQAMALLGVRLLDGDGIEKNVAEGEKWLRKTADTGELWAMRVLGNRLLDGDGIAMDAAEGEKWLRKAADAGDLKAMMVLGDRLLDGDGIAMNAAEGEKWLRKAADAGELNAMVLLGIRLIEADGIESLEKIVMQGPTVDAFLQINN